MQSLIADSCADEVMVDVAAMVIASRRTSRLGCVRSRGRAGGLVVRVSLLASCLSACGGSSIEPCPTEAAEVHLEARRKTSRPLFAELLSWGRAQRGRHEPRSAAGRAVNYLLNNRRALRVFLTDPRVPLDNNASERDMRPVAMGRSNYLFFQNKESGERHAVLYTLVKSAEKNGLNPTTYLADVLVRVHTHPQSRVDELLPHRWKPPDA